MAVADMLSMALSVGFFLWILWQEKRRAPVISRPVALNELYGQPE